jgi:hypothetical protein
MGPAIPAADSALKSGSAENLLNILENEVRTGLHERFTSALKKKNYDLNDVDAGREFGKAYVKFLHYVEPIYQAAAKKNETNYEQQGLSDPYQ